jgi:hypothetical protein
VWMGLGGFWKKNRLVKAGPQASVATGEVRRHRRGYIVQHSTGPQEVCILSATEVGGDTSCV